MTPNQRQRPSDQELQAAVTDELAFVPSVDATHVGVSVTDGAVTLAGEVTSLPERLAARKAVLRVHGVLAVADELVVRVPGVTGTTDIDIARAAGQHLEHTADVPPCTVRATVREHVVTLTGTVRWDYQRRAAERAVSYIRGVTGVDNRIELDQPVSTIEVKEAIEAAFLRDAQIDARHITVEARGHELTLRGEVRSWAEHARAEHCARQAPGATSVKNDLRVVI
ncbi:BON domain-containing protein [Longispora sp. K20-0274]|uniref:BON domain-containing protein n=1 Tax=Longispora sp. K20-0274 TaxID=3088255 RepID=UPI00399B134C